MVLPNLLVIGCSGAGKSTFLNCTFGAQSQQRTRCFTSTYEGEKVKVWDCPGAFDGDTSIQDWSDKLVESTKGVGFQQLLLVVNGSNRPGTIDTMITIGIRVVLEKLDIAKGVSVVFTHMDARPNLAKESERAKWIEALNKKCKLPDSSKIDSSKSIPFVPSEVADRNPEAVLLLGEESGLISVEPPAKRAKLSPEASQQKAKTDAHQVLGAFKTYGAKVLKPALKSGESAKTERVGLVKQQEMLKLFVTAVGQEAVNEQLGCLFRV